MLKRAVDIVISIIALVLLFPILLGIALILLFTQGRPVFFIQLRPGLHGRAFRMIKFASMTNERDAKGELLPASQRVTRFGRLLRRTSVDELPELWNVLKGEMSLVGPRPLLMEYLPLYSPQQHRRHLVRPGITGWAQVNGRDALSWDEKFALDLWYVDNHSFWLDCKILFLTIKRVIDRKGNIDATKQKVAKFRGNHE